MAASENVKSPEAGKKRLNPEILWLAAIILLAIVIRTMVVLGRDMIAGDETSFTRMADNLLLGSAPWEITGTSATEFSILYPFITAAFAVVTRDVVSAGYAVSVLFSSLMVLPVYMFGKVMWNQRVATAAAALVATLPLIVDIGSTVDGQNVFAFWLLCGLFFGYRMQFTKRCMCGMLAGTCLGLAYLSDPSALFYVVVLLVLLVIIGIRQEVASYANKAAAQFIATFLVFAIPGIIFMTWQEGSFTMINGTHEDVYASVNQLVPGTLASEADLMGLDEAGDIRLAAIKEGDGYFASLINDPGATLEASARSAYHDYFRGIHSIIPVWLLPLIGIGMFKQVWTRREGLKYAYFGLVLVPLLILPVIWGDLRYVLPFLGIAALLIAKGWINLEEWLEDTDLEISAASELSESTRQNYKFLLAALVLAPLIALSFWNISRVDLPVEFKDAGEAIAAFDEEDILVMSRESSAAFYADGDLVMLPYATLEQTLDYGRRNDVDYLVVSREVVATLRPQLEALMDPDNVEDLEAVYQANQGGTNEIIVYRF